MTMGPLGKKANIKVKKKSQRHCEGRQQRQRIKEEDVVDKQTWKQLITCGDP